MPKVTPATPGAAIKQNLTQLAQETIEHINSLSSIAFGDVKYQSQTSGSKIETETLTSILLDMLRQNIKLYCNNFIR
jgi:isocitrate/isopropylmalate dehydrogenase